MYATALVQIGCMLQLIYSCMVRKFYPLVYNRSLLLLGYLPRDEFFAHYRLRLTGADGVKDFLAAQLPWP